MDKMAQKIEELQELQLEVMEIEAEGIFGNEEWLDRQYKKIDKLEKELSEMEKYGIMNFEQESEEIIMTLDEVMLLIEADIISSDFFRQGKCSLEQELEEIRQELINLPMGNGIQTHYTTHLGIDKKWSDELLEELRQEEEKYREETIREYGYLK